MSHSHLRLICEQISRNLDHTFLSSDIKAPSYRGKVRDVFEVGKELIIVTSDRVSVFDQVVGTIPVKGALLTAQSTYWLKKAASVTKTHLLAQEDPQIQRCKRASPFKFEMIVRGYLTGSLLREPAERRGQQYGLKLDPAMAAYSRFEKPIITPSTKAERGEHDEPVSQLDIVSAGLASKAQMDQIAELSLNLFALGSAFAKERGLILVDTKYEFGICDGEITLIDEVHTADSSRYWIESTYPQRLSRGCEPEMLDKERLRRTLIAQGVDPKGHSPIPALSEEVRTDLAIHYWELTETLMGHPFTAPSEPAVSRVANWIENHIS